MARSKTRYCNNKRKDNNDDVEVALLIASTNDRRRQERIECKSKLIFPMAIVLITVLFLSNHTHFTHGFNHRPLPTTTKSYLSPAQQNYRHGEVKAKTTSNTAVFAFSSRQQQQQAQKKKNKKSKNSQRKRKNNSKTTATTTLLSEDELTSYVVSALYYRKKSLIINNGKIDDTNAATSTQSAQHRQEQHNLNNCPALVLNADYQPMSQYPLSLWHWHDAVRSIFNGKCTVVDVYPDTIIRTVNFDFPLPSVVVVNEYVSVDKRKTENSFGGGVPPFNRQNVYLRDQFMCQYCNQRFKTSDLSIDHVIPRCKGGQLVWENAVTCCNKCNCKKGQTDVKDLESIGMNLARKPFIPTTYELAAIANNMLSPMKRRKKPNKKFIHKAWEPYL